MSGFKSNQSMDPSYNDYSNQDASDQIVDFSKKYGVDEDDDRQLPPVENLELSLPSVNSEVIQQPPEPSDEVKFFYTEGTPIIKSSSSSYWDLREVGSVEQSSENLMSEVRTSMVPCFPLAHNFSMGAASTSTGSCINSTVVAGEIHSYDPSKEDECIIQETEASITKMSSPLMFSRSSSVCSLNSFEQHSFVDDRSSISAFSNLASGMISPSEIPDSPFGVSSPFISKSKNNEFLFPSDDKPDDPLVDGALPNGDLTDEAFEDYVENYDVPKVYNDEGDNQSVSNLSDLSIQANSTRLSISVIKNNNGLVCLTQKSSVTVNCSVTDEEATLIGNSQNLEISHKSDVPEQNCINTIPSRPLDVIQSENTQIVTKEDKGTSTSEDSNFFESDFERILNLSSGAKMSTPLKKNKKFICEEAYKENSFFQQYRDKQNQSSDYSKDNSDDESDELVAQCILKGMPSQNKPMFNDSKQSLNHSFQTSGSSLKDSFEVPNCSFSDNDFTDDDDDGIMSECVRLGMPQISDTMQVVEKSPALAIPSCSKVNTNELPVSNSPSHQLKILDEILLQGKHLLQKSIDKDLNRVVLESVEKEEIPRNFAKEEEISTFNMISQSKSQLDDSKNDLAESDDDDSDNDESNLLVKEIIQLGMPKIQLGSPKSSVPQLVRKSQKGTKPPVIYPPNKNLGCRDNCPDGVSDGEDEDDDDLLNEIIKAGKPDANKSECSTPGPSVKHGSHRRLTAAEDRQLYLNSSLYGKIPPINPEDIACVYNTEDTPILSPALSLSDLSTLSFAEDKSGQESYLNNSRNSDCSSDSEDDEMVQQCIRQGMPARGRVAA